MIDIAPAAWIAYLAPLAGMLLIALLGARISARGAGLAAGGAMLISFIASVATLLAWSKLESPEHGVSSTAWTWLSSGSFRVPWNLYIDPLSIWMLLIVTGVGFLIHVYSLGYMAGDPQTRRFFAYLNLFVFSMLTLVLAGNMVFLLVGWGLVGMASYLLIGFWHDRPTAVAAAKKAFVINAIGDVAIMLAIFLLFEKTGQLSWIPMFEALPQTVAAGSGMAFIICLLILGGAFAKSAQLPLHTWLPDAMEGPTPVSALIHAATMVTAGVYAISRLHPVFDLSVDAQQVTFLVGALTLVMAGFIALSQTDIKRVIAYSTMSQIGYMIMAAGIGAYGAAMFHLATHALFKALLFLGAGVVIHALADEQDIRKMGGLKAYMPKTYALFLIGSLALAGIFPFAGFFSKDEILAFTLAAGEVYGAWAYMAYALALVGVVMTGMYAFRLVFLVFHGPPSELVEQYGRGELAHHGHSDAHEPESATQSEGPASMMWPVMLLGAGALVGGLLGIAGVWNVPHDFLDQAESAPTRAALHAVEFTPAETWLLALVVSLPLALLGIGIAYLKWGHGAWNRQISAPFRGIVFTLERAGQVAWGWDALYDKVFARPAQAIAQYIQRADEAASVQLVDEVSLGARDATSSVSRWQTGLVRVYAFGTVVAAAAIVVAFVWLEL